MPQPPRVLLARKRIMGQRGDFWLRRLQATRAKPRKKAQCHADADCNAMAHSHAANAAHWRSRRTAAAASGTPSPASASRWNKASSLPFSTERASHETPARMSFGTPTPRQ